MHQFQHAVSKGSVEQFLALGGLYPEMAAHERALDQYVEMLRKDQVRVTAYEYWSNNKK